MVNDIIFVIYSTFPDYVGGREAWVYGIAKTLAMRGYSIFIYSLKPSKPNKSYYHLENFKNIKTFRISTMLSIPICRWFILRSRFKYLHFINIILFSILVSIKIRLRSKNSSIIVLQKLGFEALTGCLLRNHRRKIIALTHGNLMREMKMQFPHPIAVFLNKITENYTAKRMDKIVSTHNDEMKFYLNRLKLDKKKCVVLLNGIDVNQFKQRSAAESRIKSRKNLGISNSETVLVNVATILLQKGQKYLIKAIAQLPIRYKNVIKLLFVGKGNTKELFEVAKKLGVTDRILFLGTMDNVFEILYGADVFVLPSLFEGLPISLLEAIGCGLPVIVTNLSGIQEVVSDNGIRVPPSDPEKLKDAIIEMIDNYAIYYHKAIAAKNRIITQHSWDTIADQFIDIIRE